MNKKFINISFCVFAVVFLLLFSYKTALFFTPLSPDQQNAVDFLHDKTELAEGYTGEEISHLEDVKNVMRWADIVFYLSLLIGTTIFTYYKKDKRQIKKLLRYSGISTVAFVSMILLLALTSFDFLFTNFHHLFFPQGNWLFPYDSFLIQTFPIGFFVSLSRNIFLLAFILGIIFIVLGYYQKNDR
ncbi:hypothetical protein COV20_00420 [Candidatus Woesearchaeota archaeon CG10_big_fil_rev_8_21_14_0_10_45_16]|nr:MAG: hypothetical protein COV20_00420 [Candidatus Woesearchaeota archaeon CG10_big_fil_rev_8_21_14_0_10_45_16]